jgi:hypothetical protein
MLFAEGQKALVGKTMSMKTGRSSFPRKIIISPLSIRFGLHVGNIELSE